MSLFKNLLIIAKGKAIEINEDINDKAIKAKRVITENKIQAEHLAETEPKSKPQKQDPKIRKILIELKQFYKSDSNILKELSSLTDKELLCIDKDGYLEWKSRND